MPTNETQTDDVEIENIEIKDSLDDSVKSIHWLENGMIPDSTQTDLVSREDGFTPLFRARIANEIIENALSRVFTNYDKSEIKSRHVDPSLYAEELSLEEGCDVRIKP